MNWTRSLMLLLGAWVLVAGSGCPQGEKSCEEIYGQIEGYRECGETESSCLFYRADTENAPISCAAICAFEAATCLAAYNPVAGLCDLANEIDCENELNASVCECGVPIEGVNNRIHIINGSNVPGITVTVTDATNESYDAGELPVAAMCCDGPNFLIEAGIGQSIVIEAEYMELTVSKTCVVTPDADSPVGNNLQTFVNVFIEGAELIIACDLGLADANGGTGS